MIIKFNPTTLKDDELYLQDLAVEIIRYRLASDRGWTTLRTSWLTTHSKSTYLHVPGYLHDHPAPPKDISKWAFDLQFLFEKSNEIIYIPVTKKQISLKNLMFKNSEPSVVWVSFIRKD